MTYRGCTINYDPPPVPFRDMDWAWVHPDYDCDADQDGFYATRPELAGWCASEEECRAEIDAILDHALPVEGRAA